MGILRISDEGIINATSHCNQACKQEFAKHASSSTKVENRMTKVLVLNCDGKKIKLSETCLFRYYKGDEHKQVSHRDDFLSCSACNKVCHFELRSRDACRFYHDAAARENKALSRRFLHSVGLIHRPRTETIFSNEELGAFVGQIRVKAPHYIEIACGCTNKTLGDSSGILCRFY
ncbi:hypothetical protein L1987_79938 [Smallanthus sonchifolius]|uniref:Uncharacterized protein n=1 Tax=Smallanthus sonchifolius TaxID=185202 RepID=A0ACB8YKJ6_9ASTR|nr:hypothetical protein L1987_79938 [Smallanthus sonchifolius]